MIAAQQSPAPPPVRGHVLWSRSWRWVTEVRGSAHLALSVWMLRPSQGGQRAPFPAEPSLHDGGGWLPVILLRPDQTAVIEAIDCGILIY